MKNIIICLCALFLPVIANAQAKYEMRAVWLTTIGGIDWPHTYARDGYSVELQKSEFRKILDNLQKAGINTVLLQTRIRSTVIYPSSIEPWDGCLSGKPGVSPGYDVLRFAIDECHSRGMELHAWIVAIPIGKWNSIGCVRIRKRYKGLVKRIGGEGYMDPENPETAEYISNVCEEITKKYDIDGIHLDYIRYPENWHLKVSRAQGRENISSIVRKIYMRVKAVKPWVKMSCAPVGKHDDLSRYCSNGWNAYNRVCQDAQGWLRDGLMDVIFPMMYFKDNNFYPFAIDWAENSHGRIVAPGLGIYFMESSEKDWPLDAITREMEFLRRNDMGYAFFRSKFFTDNLKGLYEYTANTYNQWLALSPPLTWECSEIPQSPDNLFRIKSDLCNVDELSWSSVYNDSVMIRYNVYSSNTYPVDTEDARNLVAIKLGKTRIKIPRNPKRYYSVTAINRFGIESVPVQETIFEQLENESDTVDFPFLDCDGKFLMIPDMWAMIDAKYFTIENLMGVVLEARPYRGRKSYVGHLPEGVYILKSLGRKGVRHRLGHFVVRRNF